MSISPEQAQETWDEFLKEWPIERLRTMRLEEYTAVGQSHTFTAWIEQRLDKLGSIWGGSSFKFGIFSRRDKSRKTNTNSESYSRDYAWYSKYGSSPAQAFAKVKALVVEVAEAAARGEYAAIDNIDLGNAYRWKIAFHYQNRSKPGVIAVFKKSRLADWLQAQGLTVPDEVSARHRAILTRNPGRDIVELSEQVWRETTPEVVPEPGGKESPGPPFVPEPVSLSETPLNLILYGPPGTGKTYATAELAVDICDGKRPEGREELMARYRELRRIQRIRFVTFHPSFAYEEFVEGIRPSTADDGTLRYDVRSGVLKRAATTARELFTQHQAPAPAVSQRTRPLFKMSLGDSTKSTDDWIFQDCLDNNVVAHAFARRVDFTGCDSQATVRERYKAAYPAAKETSYAITAVHQLKNGMKEGDLVVVADGNTKFRAIAEVTGPYVFDAEAAYPQRRPVRWLWSTAESLPVELISTKRLSQMSIYRVDQTAVKWDAVWQLVTPQRDSGAPPNCVLVIDEINRANLAKTFGELITLVEPSKRLGQPDEQVAELPYSGELLGIPPNLYILGTMNTADRSIALMDTALRRRFQFREMLPRVDLLERDVGGIDLQALLLAMNARIEALFDRDHVLGHAYLMGVRTFEDVAERFQRQIVPLLQEYFFDDWGRIQQVFRDAGEPHDRQIIQDSESHVGEFATIEVRKQYRINSLIRPAAIQKIYE
jgi:5-methylcytosine-specific restriction endonuclease McrBC GTP-binding regulatory subunit McrB